MSKKQKFTLEYPVRCSPTILYEFLATSNGLQEWFADKVDDKTSEELSFTISQKIEKEMVYPGQVKVTVIREKRSVSVAR